MERQVQANDKSSPVDGAHSLLGDALHACAGYVFGERSKVTEAITNYGPETLYAGALLFPGGKAVAASAAIGALNEIRTDDSLKEGFYDAVLGSVKGGATKFAFDKIGGVEFTTSILNAPVKGVVMGSTSTLLDSGLSRRTYDQDGRFDLGTGIDRTIQSVFSPQAMAVNAATFGFAGGASAVLNKLSGGFVARSPGVATLLTGSTFGIASGGISEASRQAALGDGFDIGKIASESAIHGALYGLAAVPAGLKVGFSPRAEAAPLSRIDETASAKNLNSSGEQPAPSETIGAQAAKPLNAAPASHEGKSEKPAGAQRDGADGDEPANDEPGRIEESNLEQPAEASLKTNDDTVGTLQIFHGELNSEKEIEPTKIVAKNWLGQTTMTRLSAAEAAVPEWEICPPDGAKYSVNAAVRINNEGALTISGHLIDPRTHSLEDIAATFFVKPDITHSINAQLTEMKKILAPLSDPAASLDSRNEALRDIHAFIQNHRSPTLNNSIRDEMAYLPAESQNALSRYFNDRGKEQGRRSGLLRDTAFQMMREGQIDPSVISEITKFSDVIEKSKILNDEQKNRTSKDVLELLDDGNDPRIDAAERIQVPKGMYRVGAIQSAMHTANPNTITQYAHPTCALASLEVAAYTRAPEVATSLVSEVLRTGKFVTTDGTVIKIDPFSLRAESGSERIDDVALNGVWTPNAYRSYASQIFQTTAANVHWQTQRTNPDGKIVPRGSLRYELRYDPADITTSPKGYVVDYSQPIPKSWEANGYTDIEVMQISNLISENLKHAYVSEAALATEESFQQFLAQMPRDKMPIAVSVDARYLSQALANSPDILGHAININASLDPARPGGKDKWLVKMKNPWSGRAEYMSIKKLYEMCRRRPDFKGPLGQTSQKVAAVSREDFARATSAD